MSRLPGMARIPSLVANSASSRAAVPVSTSCTLGPVTESCIWVVRDIEGSRSTTITEPSDAAAAAAAANAPARREERASPQTSSMSPAEVRRVLAELRQQFGEAGPGEIKVIGPTEPRRRRAAEPEPEPKPEDSGDWMYILGAVAVILVIGAFIYLSL